MEMNFFIRSFKFKNAMQHPVKLKDGAKPERVGALLVGTALKQK